MLPIRSCILAGLALAAALAARAEHFSDSGTFTKTYTLSVPASGTVYAIVTAWSNGTPVYTGAYYQPYYGTPAGTAVGVTKVIVPGMNGEAVNVTASCASGANTSSQYVTNLPIGLGPYQIIHMGFVYGGPGPAGVNSETTVSW